MVYATLWKFLKIIGIVLGIRERKEREEGIAKVKEKERLAVRTIERLGD